MTAISGRVTAARPSAADRPRRRYFSTDGRELQPHELPMQQAVARAVDVRDQEITVLLPSGRNTYDAVHARGPSALFEGAAQAGDHRRAPGRRAGVPAEYLLEHALHGFTPGWSARSSPGPFR